MEHVTSHRRLNLRGMRPDVARDVASRRALRGTDSGFATAVRAVGRLGSWLAGNWSDPIGDRLERQREHDAQMIRRYDHPTR